MYDAERVSARYSRRDLALVAIGQIRVIGGEPDVNMGRAIAAIHLAARKGADLIVLPECLDLGWTHPLARTRALPIPGERSDRLSATAAEARINVVAGLTESANGAVHNTAVFLDRKGTLLASHRKINILNIEADLYAPGSSLTVFATELGSTSLAICADCLPDAVQLPLGLSRMGARTILSPCAWAVPPDYDSTATPYGAEWLDAYSTTAHHGTTMVGVSCVGMIFAGPWEGHLCIGRSLVVAAGGRTIYHGPYGADADTVDLVSVPLGHASLEIEQQGG